MQRASVIIVVINIYLRKILNMNENIKHLVYNLLNRFHISIDILQHPLPIFFTQTIDN